MSRMSQMSHMSQTCLLITLIKCLKGHKSLGSLGSVVKGLIVSWVRATNQGTKGQGHLLSCSGQLKRQKNWCFSLEGHSFNQKKQIFCTEMKFPPSFMISWWTWARQDYLVSFFLPAITTSQGYISNVFTVSQCSQRNSLDILKELRLSRLIFCFHLHRTGVHQWSLQCLKVSAKECVINSVQLEGKVWDLTQLSSQARDTSKESFLFQSICNFSSL